MTDPRNPIHSPDRPPRRRRWLVPVLVLSVALNLAVAGIVTGVFLGRAGMPHEGYSGRDISFRPFTQAMTEADRAAMTSAFRARGGEWRRSRAEREAESAEILSALRSEPFEPERLDALFGAQRDRSIARLELGHALLLERVREMSPAERAAFADRLEEAMQRPWRRSGRSRSGD